MTNNTGNSLILRWMSFKNIMSFGSNETKLQLDGDLMSVIMGVNYDTGGEDSRNGSGKSAIIDALCYCLFGSSIRNAPNQKLINKFSRKGQPMIVTVAFDKGNYSYLVERSERPSKLLLLRKPIDSDENIRTKSQRKYKYDISRNKKETTSDIIALFGFDMTLFEYLVANSSESTPFPKLDLNSQREVVEKLFGFTILSERAARIKNTKKTERENLIKEETKYATNVSANKRVEEELKNMERRSANWERDKQDTIAELQDTIERLTKIDTQGEIELLKLADEMEVKIKELQGMLREHQAVKRNHTTILSTCGRSINDAERNIKEAERNLESTEKSICPTCKQHWVPDPEYVEKLINDIATATEVKETNSELSSTHETEIENINTQIQDITEELTELNQSKSDIESSGLHYSSVEEASKAETVLDNNKEFLDKELASENPHLESILNLKTKAITKVDDSKINELRSLIKHFDFLISLLTDRNSFIRKQIISKWLPKLNSRLTHYLNILELPFKVRFMPDMTMEVIKHNEDYDYGLLSRGERNRLNLVLNFSFQDIFEYMNYRINTLIIDELIDNGICNRGAENTVNLLKSMSLRKHKRIFLVTHREDIKDRVDDIMVVEKENDISRIRQNVY